MPSVTDDTADNDNGHALAAHREPEAAGDLSLWLEGFPSQAACYALYDRQGRRVHLGTTSHLKQSLKKTFLSAEAGSLVHDIGQVRWRVVCSRFEADWVYLENRLEGEAGEDLPLLLRQWSHCWLTIDWSEIWPCWRVTGGVGENPAFSFGPFATRSMARVVLEEAEDLFDLCREHGLLVQAPGAVPCAYKAMGRCTSACDGGVSRGAYMEQLKGSAEYLAGNVSKAMAILETRMRRAAETLRFEEAESRRKKLEALRRGDPVCGRGIRSADRLGWLSFQPDASRRRVRAFLVGAGWLQPMGLLAVDADAADRLQLLEKVGQQVAGHGVCQSLKEKELYRLSMAAWHAGRTGRGSGVMLALQELSDAAVQEALKRFDKTAPDIAEPEENTIDER